VTEGVDIGFQRLTAADLPLLYEWVRRDHVRRWWGEDETYESLLEDYLPAIEGREPSHPYLILLDGRPVGFIQTYLVEDYPEWVALLQVEAGVAGADIVIGDVELTGQGLGTAALRQFVEEIVFADPATGACIADPDVENTASLRAFEKAGFRRVGEFLDPEDGRLHAIVRRDRAAGLGDRPGL
jgi:aminoglycoside 6'-N-acetyltransferase